MSWARKIISFTNDQVRMVQTFTLCRQTGIILGSIVVARVLPLEDVGIMELLMFCGYIMTFFWSDAFLKGYLASKGKDETAIPTTTFFLFCFLAGLAFMGLLVLLKPVLIPLLTDRKNLPGLTLFGFYQAFILPLWLAPFAGGLRKHNIVLLSAFVLVGPAFACWVGYTSIPGINGILIGLLSYSLVGFGWMLTQLPLSGNIGLQKFLIKVWPVTWPLILYAISSAIARSLDAFLVAHYFDERVFAIFRYGAREFPLVASLAAGLSTVMIARLAQGDNVEELKTRSTRLMHICYPVIACLIVVSVPLFQIVFGESFRESALIFNLYLLLTLTQLVFPQTVFMAKGNTRLLWYVSLSELVVNVAASLLLLQQFGLIGIVWGTLIAFAYEKIVLFILLIKQYSIRLKELVDQKVWALYAVLLILSFFLSTWMFGL